MLSRGFLRMWRPLLLAGKAWRVYVNKRSLAWILNNLRCGDIQSNEVPADKEI
jgi:hypothetical protein